MEWRYIGVLLLGFYMATFVRGRGFVNVARGKSYIRGALYNVTDECISDGLWLDQESRGNFYFEVDLGRKYPAYNFSFGMSFSDEPIHGFHISVDDKPCLMRTLILKPGGNISVICAFDLYGQKVRITSSYTFSICDLGIWACLEGYFGPGCDLQCPYLCKNNMCDQRTGVCMESVCSDGYYGFDCTQKCGNCNNSEVCDKWTGHCSSCSPGLPPPLCHAGCQPGLYGDLCVQRCPTFCRDNICDPFTGRCLNNEQAPTTLGSFATSECPPGWYGDQCDQECRSQSCLLDMCNQTTGWCLACRDSYAGENCKACLPGWYGNQCDQECRSQRCFLNMCDQTTGWCLACDGGYVGDNCTVCLPGWYGDRCDTKCRSQSCLLDISSQKTGRSLECNRGFAVDNDDVGLSQRQFINAIVGAIISVGLLLIIAVVATICCHHRSQENKKEAVAMPSSNFSDGSAHSNYYSHISDGHELRPSMNLPETPLARDDSSVNETLANQASNVHTSTDNPDAESQYDSISVCSTSSSGSLLSSVYATDKSRYLHPIFNPTYSDRLKGITST